MDQEESRRGEGRLREGEGVEEGTVKLPQLDLNAV
jgi:hypothetical protein